MVSKQVFGVLNDLKSFGVPLLILSGGEPLMRPDLIELAHYAVDKGMRAVISTNGTLITREKAVHLQAAIIAYIITQQAVRIKPFFPQTGLFCSRLRLLYL